MWEARSLYFVAVGVLLYGIYEPVGLAFSGFAMLVIFVMVSHIGHSGGILGKHFVSSFTPFAFARHLLYRTPSSPFS